ncbi:hypothetical protein KDA00_04645 [Candidatus Saccharibacteria bacterium]|nr:hypothetical protein [Candidatus Saccharibacteria bacterium]
MERDKMLDSEVVIGGEMKPDLDIVKLTDGLGFGDKNGISHNRRISEDATAEDLPVLLETVNVIEDHIASSEVLVPVDTDKDGKMLDDDGCGDGRGWKKIVVKVGDTIKEKMKSLNRAKQFGGGITMAMAGLVANGKVQGQTLRSSFSDSIKLLEQRRLGFGAHTDDHAHGPNCGCGAIDRAPEILNNAIVFESQIREVSINVLGLDEQDVDVAYQNIKSFLPSMESESYKGSDVADEVINEGKVVKELTGPHLEMYILLNEVDGFTVDQAKIRELSDERVQAFSVDVWRMRQQANDSYDNPEEANVAFAGAVIYTLATAGTLTAGDLPVYLIKKAA